MFKANTGPYQRPLLGGTLNELDEKKRKVLEKSWAEAFRQSVLLNIDELAFAELYSLDASRPNIAVNVLVGWEIIKIGQGLSDRAMHERFLFDIQMRHALGLDTLNGGGFELRTVYNFRNRLVEHEEETGINLIHECFRHVTDEQISICQVNSSQLRVDSVQIASNIAEMGRL